MHRTVYHSTKKNIVPRKSGTSAKKIGQLVAGLALLWVLLAGLPVKQVEAGVSAQKKGAGSPYAVIDAVNAIRSARGLAPFKVNGALMAAAQAHSEYQASIGSATHTGRGGSDIKSRAIAAGYGGGAGVSVTENIYSGMGATPQQAVSWWQGDGLHLQTLLSTSQTDAGAGVAVSDAGVVYYTLDVGTVSGSGTGDNGSAAPPATGGSGVSGAAPATAVSSSPFLISTAMPDGALIHEVQPGQTLWAIAAAYDINILDLLNINGLNANSFIVPGQKIVIHQAGSVPTETTEPEEKAEKPTRTPRPTATPTQPATEQANLQPTLSAPDNQNAQAIERAAPSSGLDPLMILIVGLMAGGLVLIVAGNVLKRFG